VLTFRRERAVECRTSCQLAFPTYNRGQGIDFYAIRRCLLLRTSKMQRSFSALTTKSPVLS
jgi:hypothetical protein